MEGKGNVGKPDTPGVETSEMQRIMDELPREVIAPKFNKLVDDLGKQTAAQSIGATVPSGLTASENVQSILNALLAYIDKHKNNSQNPHSVTAEQTGAYTREETDSAIDKKVVEIGSGDMSMATYDPDHIGIDLGVQLYKHTKSGTIHDFSGHGINGRAKITATFNKGDTVRLNGKTVTATCGADPVDGDTIVNGKWVSFVADESGNQINFNGGGGLSGNKLSLATAETADVISGKKFYAGNKTIKTGTLVDLGREPQAQGGTMYNGSLYFYIGENGGQRRWALTRGCYMPQNEVASIIGLTSEKLISGNTVLGVYGTGTTPPSITPINQSAGWGDGEILTSYGCWSGLTNTLRMCFHWRADSDYNVSGYIIFLKNGAEVASQAFSKGNGFIDKTFTEGGNYQIKVRVDYHAGNGTFYIGGMMVGY